MVERAADTFFDGCRYPESPADVLEERLRLILEVRPGERPLLPSFGCRVHDLEAIDSEHERQVCATGPPGPAYAGSACSMWRRTGYG